jgi:hypothetical protein
MVETFAEVTRVFHISHVFLTTFFIEFTSLIDKREGRFFYSFPMKPSQAKWQTQSLYQFQTNDSDLIQTVPPRRTHSLEPPSDFHPPVKSNLRVKTQRESLQSNLGTSKPETSKRLGWRDVCVQKYERTVGDNPSCRSGPPLR